MYGHIIIFRSETHVVSKSFWSFSTLVEALLLGGVCTAILTGCNQSAQDNSTTDTAATADAATAMKTVAITAIVEHPALDDVRKGVIDELNEAGFKDGENFKG